MTNAMIGLAGWSYADWEGTVYPKPKPRDYDPLGVIAEFLDCIEINTSFYRVPKPEAANSWIRRVAGYPGFRFTAKLYRGFTHEQPPSVEQLEADARSFRAFAESIQSAGRLSAVLVQFPLRFHDGDAARRRLSWIADRFADLHLVVELRHRSWFEPAAYNFLEERNLSLATIDLPAAADHPPANQRATGPIGYLRMHGRNAKTWFDPKAGRDQRYDYLYAPSELDSLVKRARELARQHEQTFVITNNHFQGQAVANAVELAAELRGGRLEVPRDLIRTYPRLSKVADAGPGQGELF